ncbi:unnamed protein product [Coffea canephora]|uniref:DH200=94 genomic scaffold, scaffold_473 n=1 Tax=Coffea canephora TaxID=49390 RepID=A0A068VFB2_COFCA|nr:unnamed protein product [Coffea canephora]
MEWVKLNTDASVVGSRASGGGLLRDHSGKLIFSFSKEFGDVQVLQAEASALSYGLQICISKRFRKVLVEVDSKVLVSLIHSSDMSNWPLCKVLLLL